MLDRLVESADWFARAGFAPDDAEHAVIAGLCARAGSAGGVTLVRTWIEAARHLDLETHDARHWDAQEEERERLWDLATDRCGEQALLEAATGVRARFDAALRDAAHVAANRLASGDARFEREAAGAAHLALQHALLVQEAAIDAPHPFVARLELFARGRWPIGESDGRTLLF